MVLREICSTVQAWLSPTICHQPEQIHQPHHVVIVEDNMSCQLPEHVTVVGRGIKRRCTSSGGIGGEERNVKTHLPASSCRVHFLFVTANQLPQPMMSTQSDNCSLSTILFVSSYNLPKPKNVLWSDALAMNQINLQQVEPTRLVRFNSEWTHFRNYFSIFSYSILHET